jgi:hypothetical protein
MGKKQHRRTVSMTALLYARLKSHCDARRIPVAAFVQAVLIDALDDEHAPVVQVRSRGYSKRVRESTAALAKDLAKQPPAQFTF